MRLHQQAAAAAKPHDTGSATGYTEEHGGVEVLMQVDYSIRIRIVSWTWRARENKSAVEVATC